MVRHGTYFEDVADIPDALCNVCSLILDQPPAPGPCPCCSFQMITLPSYEHDAKICPNFGCAHATCQTGPVCLAHPGTRSERARDARETTNSPLQSMPACALRLAVNNIKHLHRPVRGARRKPLAIVVELSIVLGTADRLSVRAFTPARVLRRATYDDVLVVSLDWRGLPSRRRRLHP